jgi:DNA-binding MarR family transcriptional regulator
MAASADNDPILEAYQLWIGNGWEDSADGLAAVTSIMRVNQVLAKRADEILSPADLTFSRYEVLVRLHFNDGALRMTHLGKLLQVHQTSVTGLVDKLEAQGLIKRTPHPTDRRSTVVRITPAGDSLLQKAIKLLNSELFRDLGLTGDEVRALTALLTKLRRSWADVERCPEPGEPA